MKIVDLISALRAELKKHGNIEVVSGVRRSGYAEPVAGMEAMDLALFNPATGKFNGEAEKVLDLGLDEHSFAAIREE